MHHRRTAAALAALGTLLAANPLYADALTPLGLGGGYGWFVDVGVVLVVVAALLAAWDHHDDGPVTVLAALAVAAASVAVFAAVLAVVPVVAAGSVLGPGSAAGISPVPLQDLLLYASIPAGLPLGVALYRDDRRGLLGSAAVLDALWLVYVGSAYADGSDMGDFLAFVNVAGAAVVVLAVVAAVGLGDFGDPGPWDSDGDGRG